MEEGKRVSPSVPYGYYRNPKNKQELLVDKESAKKYLKEYLGESKTLAISKWKSEVTTLKKEKKSLYNQILEIREEVEKAEKGKTCREQLHAQEKRLSQVKRNELDL